MTDSSAEIDDSSLIVFRVIGGKGNSACQDDPTWVDQDGDGCQAYEAYISEGFLTREVACGFESSDLLQSGDPEGAALHCRATCGTCPAEPDELKGMIKDASGEDDGVDRSCVDDPTWTDEDGDGCNVYAKHIENGEITRELACGFQAADDKIVSGNPEGAATYCRATCGTCGQEDSPLLKIAQEIVNESPQYNQSTVGSPDLATVLAQDQALDQDSFSETEVSSETETHCADDSDWVDMDGDGCEVYADAIAKGDMTEEQACGRAHVTLETGNPSEAAKYCPVTCGNCPFKSFEENDAEMKDTIRMLVEQESELILQEANVDEEVEDDVPIVKKLPEPELSSNSTWVVYWAPEDEEESKTISGIDLLKMAPMPSLSVPGGFKPISHIKPFL